MRISLSVPLVLAAFSGLLTGCATMHPALHFRDTPQDYAQLGLRREVEVKEDGRRSRAGSDDYEWWYLDGVSSDGTVVVAVFGDNWLPGTHQRQVTLDVTRPGQPTRSLNFATLDAGDFSRERADVRIGKSRFEGDLAHYTIHVDASDLKGMGCHLTLTRRAPSYRPGTGVMASGNDFFAWVVPVPEGALTGTLTLDGKEIPFSGTGYHDHNWGNVPPWVLMRNWWWGRGAPGGKTVVVSEMRPAPAYGKEPLTLIYVAGPDGVLVESHGTAAQLAEGNRTDPEDPTHNEPQPRFVTLRSNQGISAQFTHHGKPLMSVDLLNGVFFPIHFVAHLTGRSPWYTRWASQVLLDAPGGTLEGEGTIEFMDFE